MYVYHVHARTYIHVYIMHTLYVYIAYIHTYMHA